MLRDPDQGHVDTSRAARELKFREDSNKTIPFDRRHGTAIADRQYTTQ